MNVPYRWMAPELLKNSSAKATFVTDDFLGICFHIQEIFTASDPFEGDSDALVPSRVLQNQHPDRPVDVGDALWSLWGEGWNKDAAKRPDMESYVKRLNKLV
ncbi:hypothetical protein BYT27DRAFT_7080071 [Phlegmacium glaucopus]|nr:hypothetical protein BYT27DRAFT_7080071 [Phlegmacium glaucopus]